jgi:hypothetical protein
MVLNQVLVSAGDDDETRPILSGIEEEGTCWLSRTHWHGCQALRISVSSWATTSKDDERSVEAILRVAGKGA